MSSRRARTNVKTFRLIVDHVYEDFIVQCQTTHFLVDFAQQEMKIRAPPQHWRAQPIQNQNTKILYKLVFDCTRQTLKT